MYQFGRSIKIRSVLAADRVAYTIWYRDATYVTKRGGDINYDNPHNSVTTLKARQSTGSIAEISLLSYSSPTDFKIGARRLHSIADAELIVSYPRSGVRTTAPLRPEEVAEMKAVPADSSCVHHQDRVGPDEYLGPETWNGYSVAKHLIRSQTAVSELWEAPEFDCSIVFLKTVFLDKNGTPTDATIRSAFALKKGEPESWIFERDSAAEMVASKADAAEVAAMARQTNLRAPADEIASEKTRQKDEEYARRWRELRGK